MENISVGQDPTTLTFQQMQELADQQAQGRFAGDKNLMIQFHLEPMMDQAESEKEGRPIYHDVEHVRILIPGSKESVVDKIVTDIEKARFRERYEAWKKNEEMDLTGTPLESCTWMGKSLVEEMKFFHVRTVEQLAELSDTHSQKFPGITRYKDLAKAYLAQAEKGKAAAEVNKVIQETKRENADLKEMVKGLQDTVARLEAMMSTAGVAQPAVQPPPKTRGRRASA